MPIQKIDLNLFRVFEAIMRSRSVAGAARELNITPSAVSHALNRLRQMLDDQLFVPAESGMKPTPRALELAPTIDEGLKRFWQAVSSKPFDPQRSARTFRVGMSDYVTTIVLPYVVERISKTGPNIDLRIYPTGRTDLVEHLDNGQLDMVIAWFADLPKRMRRKAIVTESEALVTRADHPIASGPVDMEKLFSFPHVVVELTGSERTIDGFYDDQGVERRIWIERLLLEKESPERGLLGRVAISLPHYSGIAQLVARTDMIATLPRRVAVREASREPLAILDLPYEPLKVEIECVWHERGEHDQGIQWLAREISLAAAHLADN